MIGKRPSRATGSQRLTQALNFIARRRVETRPVASPDCQKPDAPVDLPTTHALMLTSIEARLVSLERQVSNQNRLLLIGILALVGELAKQVLRP